MSRRGGGRRTPDSDPRASLVYRFAAWLAFAVIRVQRWRVRVEGVEHLPRHGGAVIAANHTSFWDFFTTGWLPYRRWGRPVRILAKASLFRARGFGWFMRRAEHIPVHRGSGSSALRSAIEALERGELVLVLPEQTISPSLELLPFKPGAIRMAAAAGVPVVPAVSWGSHRFHTAGRRPRWSWRLPVTVRYGEPLWPRPGEDAEALTALLRERIATLLDEVQRSYPDGTPAGEWWVPARLGGGAPEPGDADAFLRALAEKWQRTGPVDQARAVRDTAFSDSIEDVVAEVADQPLADGAGDRGGVAGDVGPGAGEHGRAGDRESREEAS